jgi:(p)ppGpp synthase/HD superfamily hydrolase
MTADPEFIGARDLVLRSYRFAADVYGRDDLEPGAELGHPMAVARLVDAAGFGDEVVAAAFLHDVVEDSPLTPAEIAAEFGPEIGGYVATLTEDGSIDDYRERKGEHRNRVLAAGAVPASIYLADKLARTRAFVASGERIDPDRLDHYHDTLELYARRRPELPFLDELASELPALEPA